MSILTTNFSIKDNLNFDREEKKQAEKNFKEKYSKVKYRYYGKNKKGTLSLSLIYLHGKIGLWQTKSSI
jgi:hypothetical protein